MMIAEPDFEIPVIKFSNDPVTFMNQWYDYLYTDDLTSSLSGGDRVRQQLDGYIIPWLRYLARPRLDQLIRQDTDGFMLLMSGQGLRKGAPVILAEAGLVDAAEAEARFGLNRSTFKNHVRLGTFPNLVRQEVPGRTIVRVPVTDLIVSGLLDGVEKDTGGLKSLRAPSKRYAQDILQTFRAALKFARGNRLMQHDPTEGARAREPLSSKTRKRPVVGEVRGLSVQRHRGASDGESCGGVDG